MLSLSIFPNMLNFEQPWRVESIRFWFSNKSEGKIVGKSFCTAVYKIDRQINSICEVRHLGKYNIRFGDANIICGFISYVTKATGNSSVDENVNDSYLRVPFYNS